MNKKTLIKLLLSNKYYFIIFLVGGYLLTVQDYYENGTFNTFNGFFQNFQEITSTFFANLVVYWFLIILLATGAIAIVHISLFYIANAVTNNLRNSFVVSSSIILIAYFLYSITTDMSLLFFGLLMLIAEMLKFYEIRKEINVVSK